MLKETIQKEISNALRSKDEVKKSVLKVILGDVQLQESRSGKQASDDDVLKVIKRTVEGLKELIVLKGTRSQEQAELVILEALLPKEATNIEIATLLSVPEALNAIKTAKSDGQAVGVAMKALKEAKFNVNGNLVKEIVQKLRTAVEIEKLEEDHAPEVGLIDLMEYQHERKFSD